MKTPPLRGIRALELAEIWAGPFCGALLGDMGAEVIKVEALQRIARGPISPAPNTAGYPDYDPGERPWNRQGNFNATNRNKLGLTLDLTTEQGVSAFKELVNISDIVFTNYAFGVMDRLGLGQEVLRRIKPDLIVLFTPGYGNTGPYRQHRSMGMAIDAMTGHSALRGYPDLDLSHNSLVHHPDAVAAVTATFAICAALHYRARTGQGTVHRHVAGRSLHAPPRRSISREPDERHSAREGAATATRRCLRTAATLASETTPG